MAAESIQLIDPVPQQFVGDSASQVAKRLFAATRPKFFPASVLPVLAGSAWGYAHSPAFDVTAFALALLATMCVHAGANVLNDVGDDAGGTDGDNVDRIYPYTGGSRFIQTGIMSSASMARLGIALLGFAILAGLALLMSKGPMILWFGLAGILLAVSYSLGPLRLASMGLGEASVGVAFGILPITGAAWLQTGVIDNQVVWFAVPISAWVGAILLINGVPDMAADGANGKRTLAVRLGLAGTARLYFALHVMAACSVIWMSRQDILSVGAPLVPILLLLLTTKFVAAIRHGVDDVPGLRRAIEGTLAIHTVGSLWLAGVVLFTAFTSG